MLKIDRTIGQAIRINQNIEVKILGIYRNSIRFGITAPREIPVHREEVFHRIQKEIRENKEIITTERTQKFSEGTLTLKKIMNKFVRRTPAEQGQDR